MQSASFVQTEVLWKKLEVIKFFSGDYQRLNWKKLVELSRQIICRRTQTLRCCRNQVFDFCGQILVLTRKNCLFLFNFVSWRGNRTTISLKSRRSEVSSAVLKGAWLCEVCNIQSTFTEWTVFLVPAIVLVFGSLLCYIYVQQLSANWSLFITIFLIIYAMLRLRLRSKDWKV